MSRYGSMIAAAFMISACSAGGTGPSPSESPVATSAAVASAVASASPQVTSAPSPNPMPPAPTPKPTQTPPKAAPKPKPTPSPKPVAGWPAVSRAGITMSGTVLEHIDGRLRLSITVTGLASGEKVQLSARSDYLIRWVCGSEPEPCGDLGCAPAFGKETSGTARAAAHAVAASDGSSTIRMKLVAPPPAESCPADPTSPWLTTDERWKKARVADRAHGLVLTPDTIDWGITY